MSLHVVLRFMSLIQVFVSSTFVDLEEYRAAVTRAIIVAGELPSDMIFWPATDTPPINECLSRVRASNLVILLLAHRYGHVPEDGSLGVTELEYNEAKKCQIPVVPFFVHPDHPWPTKWVDRDPESIARLEGFKSAVGSSETFKHFTSPESLETSVTQALTKFRDKSRARFKGYPDAPVLAPMSAEALRYTPDATVEFGTAADGVPLLMTIKRSADLSPTLTRLAMDVGASRDGAVFRELTERLAQQAKTHWIQQNVRSCLGPDGKVDCYVTSRTMTALFSPSLLESLVGGDLNDEGTRRKQPFAMRPVTAATSNVGLMPDGIDSPVQSLGGRNRFLCVPLNDALHPWSGGLAQIEGSTATRLWRSFEEETFDRFGTVELYPLHDPRS